MGSLDPGRIEGGNPTLKRFLDNPWILFVPAWIIGGVFIVAGALKLQDTQAFADSIASYQVLPRSLINPLALGLPPLEIFVGTLCLVGWKRRPAVFLLMILTLIFSVALAQALGRGLEVDCGCFGGGPPSLWKTWTALGRDLLLVVLLGWMYHRMLQATMKEPSR